jgi:hypothetical protein
MAAYSLITYFEHEEKVKKRLFFLCLALECDVPILEAVVHSAMWLHDNNAFVFMVTSGSMLMAKDLWERSMRLEVTFFQFVRWLSCLSSNERDRAKVVEIQNLHLTDKEKIDVYFNRFVYVWFSRDKSPVRTPNKT